MSGPFENWVWGKWRVDSSGWDYWFKEDEKLEPTDPLPKKAAHLLDLVRHLIGAMRLCEILAHRFKGQLADVFSVNGIQAYADQEHRIYVSLTVALKAEPDWEVAYHTPAGLVQSRTGIFEVPITLFGLSPVCLVRCVQEGFDAAVAEMMAVDPRGSDKPTVVEVKPGA